MGNRIILLSLSFFLYFTNDLLAQLSVSASAEAASCAANGRIRVTVSGGSGDYTYQLSGPCAENIPPQQESVFDFLKPCVYTVVVVDRQTNASDKTEVEVTGDYQEMMLSVVSEGCNQRLVVEGGRRPYRFSFSPDGIDGPYQPNNPVNSSLFTNLSGSDIHLAVEDACGIRKAIATPPLLNPIRAVRFPATEEPGIALEVEGGSEPYTFRLFNDTDTLELTRDFIPWDSMLCDARLEVSDECSAIVQRVNYQPLGAVLCVNFADGTAEAEALRGVPPYIFTAFTPEGEFTSTTGSFEGLPINTTNYDFVITDACGLEQPFDPQTRLRLDVAESDQGCTDDVLNFNAVRECAGQLLPPVVATCLNCTAQDTAEINSFDQQVSWSGYQAGEWDILLENECGDRTRCQDELIVELTPGCDSIVARIVDLFTCDNGTTSRRVITGDDVTFFLRDEGGTLLVEDNETGLFDNLSQGTYEVTAVLPDCDTLRNVATLSAPEPIDPFLETWVDYAVEEGVCQLFYDVFIGKESAPYVLSGGPDGDYHQVLNDFGENNCPTFGVRLRPGTYTLASMSQCGAKTIELPNPEYDLTVSLVDNCPGDAKVLADGARTLEEWETYFAPYDLNVRNLFPDYYQDQNGRGSRQEEGFTFRGLEAGVQTIYLYAMEDRGCPIDTVEIEAPEYTPVEIGLDGDVVCDNNNTTDLDIQITGGQGPYLLRKLDCDNSQTLASFDLEEGEQFVDEGLPLGGYCYAVSDVCQVSADFQVRVRLFADSIRVGYSCDGMLHLSVDSLPVGYTWRDGSGAVLGDQYRLSIPAPEQDETYTVEVALEECVVERSVVVPAREVIPSVEIIHAGIAPVICGVEPTMLTAVTNQMNQVLWNTGDTSGVLMAATPGLYTVVSTNDLGCLDTARLDLAQVTPPSPAIVGRPGFCVDERTTLSLDQGYESVRWSTGEELDSIIVARAGPVLVTVSDENGCTGQDSLTVVEWPLPSPLISADTLICPNTTTLLSLSRSYDAYDWSDGAMTPTTSVPAGSYAVTVTDENGCRNQNDISIAERPQLFARLSGDTTICAGDSAFLSVSLTQPWNATEFRLLGSAGEDLLLQSTGDTTFWLPVNTKTDLSLNNVVIAGYDCPVVAEGTPRIVANRVNLVIQDTPIACPRGTDGALEVFAASNYPPYDFNWRAGQNTAAITGLGEGLYTVTVSDQLGCVSTDSFALQAPLPIRPELMAIPPLCRDIDDGLISLDAVRGGTPPFRWRLNGEERGGAPGEAAGLAPGAYAIALSDANDCPWDTTVVFATPPAFSLDMGEDQTIVIGETARLEPITNAAAVVYWQWTASPALEMDSALIQEVQPVERKTDFTLTVRNDYGCELTGSVSVFVDKESQFDAPSAFSPNGDGRNDRFVLYGKPSNVETIDLFEIYDRWGNKVFETTGMELNNELTGWDGAVNGQLLSPGVYVWMARVQRVDGEMIMVYGDVALVR